MACARTSSRQGRWPASSGQVGWTSRPCRGPRTRSRCPKSGSGRSTGSVAGLMTWPVGASRSAVRGREGKDAGLEVGVEGAAAVVAQFTEGSVAGEDRVLPVRRASFGHFQVAGHALAGFDEVGGDAV